MPTDGRAGPVHVSIPEMGPDFLDRLADFLEQDPAGVPARHPQRLRERAAALRSAAATPLTAASPVEDLTFHGVEQSVITALKLQSINTVGELCDRCAIDLNDVRNIGAGKIAQISLALAPFNMGLRPNPV